MSPFERQNLNESSSSPLEIAQIIETQKKVFDNKLKAVINVLEVQNNELALANFKETKDTIINNNNNALSILKRSLINAYSLNTSFLRERKITYAKSAYEILNEVNMKILDNFLKRYNISINL